MGATAPTLGTASSFAVLAGSAVTNTGSTVVSGNLGVSPGTAVTGFPPGIVAGGTIHAGDQVAGQAQNDATTAYGKLAGQPCNSNLTGQDLGGKTLTSGVYCFTTSAQLTGALTLDGQGNPDSVFIFQIGSTLTTASAASVSLINGAQSCNVFWQVGSSATLGTGTGFAGHILASASITLNTRAGISGSALAQTGAVTMDTNHIIASQCSVPSTPTPVNTATSIPATATPIPTDTTVPATAVPPTSTAVAAATNTAIAAATSTAVAVSTSTAVSAATNTAVASATNTAVSGPTIAPTAAGTVTGTTAPTPAPSLTSTSIATATATNTPVAGATATPVVAATSTSIAAATSTSIVAATSTSVNGATATAVVSVHASSTPIVGKTLTTGVPRTSRGHGKHPRGHSAHPVPTFPSTGAGGISTFSGSHWITSRHVRSNRTVRIDGSQSPIHAVSALPRTGGAGNGGAPVSPVIPFAVLGVVAIVVGRLVRRSTNH